MESCMDKIKLTALLLLLSFQQALLGLSVDLLPLFDQLVIANTQIRLKDFPRAHNPSLIKTDQGLLLVFRYVPEPSQGWISQIGAVFLNDTLQPVSNPQILNTRPSSTIPSQSEDARIFSCQGNLYLIFNDNNEIDHPKGRARRDMFLAKLTYAHGHFSLSEPLKLMHEKKYQTVLIQKNWSPFVWRDQILLSYFLNPHEVLKPDLAQGICHTFYETTTPFNWKWGQLRGGTAAQLVDGEYLGFFHSSIYMCSQASSGKENIHYFMGAYTFSPDPPFGITKMTPYPIARKDFYNPSPRDKKVIFPGGFAVCDSYIHLAYGKDDCEIWIATLDKNILNKVLLPTGYCQ